MSSDDKSILLRLEEHGHTAPRVALMGTERNVKATARYEIVGEIARGGVGIVHRGRDNDVGRDVALKVLRDEHVADKELIQRFVEEAQIGGQLQHPGIVPVYELGMQSNKRPYFAMKLVKGETLAAKLDERQGPSDGRRKLLAVLREVCRTVAYAHTRGVIHRDLKPSNVMIGNFGEVQVVDWGFAKVMRTGGVADERLAKKAERNATMISTVRTGEGSMGSVAGSVMGTPAYMPPEQALGRVEDLDARSDIFSLGAILCEILTGKPPYSGSGHERMTAAAQAHLADAYELLDACGASPKLVDLCKRCLEPLPKDRPASAQVVATAIASFLTSAEGRAHKARVRALKAHARAEEQRRSRRQTRIMASSVVLVLAIAVGAYLLNEAATANREGERRSAIQAALQDAERLRNAEEWTAAKAAAQRAIDLGADSSLAEEIRVAAGEADARETREREDDEFLELVESHLDRAVSRTEENVRRTDAAFAAAFARPEAIESRLIASRHAPQIASYLGIWCWIRKNRLKQGEWKWIDELAGRVAPEDSGLRRAMLAGDVDELLRIAHERGDDLPLPLVAQIGTTLIHERPEAASAYLTKQCERAPGDFWMQVLTSFAADRLGQPDVALRHATAALALRPTSGVAWSAMGNARQTTGDLDGAIAANRRALALLPGRGEAYNNLGNALREKGDHEGAIAALRRAVELLPDHVLVLTNLGVALQSSGAHEEALETLRRAVELDPACASAHASIGSALLETHDVDGAIAAHRRAIALDPENAVAYINLVNAYVEKRDYAAALAAARRGVELAPNGPVAHLNLGVALEFLGETEAAAVALRRAAELDPTSSKVHANLGSVLRRLGALDASLAACRRALEIDERFVSAHYGIGRVLELRGDWVAACEAYREALRIAPDYIFALAALGNALHRRGDSAEAEKLLRRAVAVTPDQSTGYGTLAMVLKAKGDREGALANALRAAELDPESSWAHGILAEMQLAAGDLDAALASARTCIRLDSRRAVGYGLLGTILDRKGDLVGAIAATRQALKLDPHKAGGERILLALLARHHSPQLRAIVAGTGQPPADTATQLEFARLFALGRQPATAVRMYRLAFESEPKLVADHAYAAACAAAQAGDEYHAEALGWLRGYLEVVRDMDPRAAAAALEYWKSDDALNDVDPEMTDGLGDVWKALWADVDAALERANSAKK